MSLRVWLPLNGNLNNQGVSNVTVTNSNATVDTSGKIGSCYSFNGSTSYIDITYANFPAILNGDFSICLWIYSNDNNDRSIYFGNWGLTGAFLNIEKTANNKVRFYWNGAPDLTPANTTITASTWNHLVITRQGNIIKFYINGTLTDTSSTTLTGNIPSDATIFRLGRDYRTDSTAFNGKFNDFRLYDHVLSPREIKEISKALILHFPLNGNGIGVPNLADNSATFSGWIVDPFWTIGTSDNGMKMYSCSRTGATANSWYRLVPTLKVDGNNYPNGITVSMDLLTPDKSVINQKCLGSLQQYDASGARTGWYEPSWDLTNVVNNQWSRIKFTFTKSALLTNSQGLVYSYTMFSFQLVQNGNISIRKIKIEEGSVATPYSISINDMNSNIEIDTSGYKNNGTKTGTISSINDTIKYNSSSKFSDSSFISYKLPPNMYYATYSFWLKFSSFTAYGAINIPQASPANGDTVWLSANTESSQLWAYFGGNSPNYTRGVSGALSANTWYHCAFVWNNGVAQWYLNGEKSGSAVTYTGKTYISNTNNSTLGDSYTGSSWNGTPFTGQLSDFRVYATVLSDADIKELYNTSISITNNGSIMCYDFEEV